MRYIGSKAKLLPQIDEMISKHLKGDEEIFADLFAGTNVVGQHFKDRFKIISNDLLYFSTVIGKATIELNEAPNFENLKSNGIDNPFKYLQSKDLSDYEGDFITNNYSPKGEDNRMLFTIDNAKRIDFIRNTIQKWFKSGIINNDEFYYLLNSLIQAVPFVSNMTGTYAAYLKKWDKRAFKTLELLPEEIINNGLNNKVYNDDAIKLADKIDADITYIDTPYNSRQYGSNYHVLETISKWDYPELHGKTGQRDTNSVKSDFARKREAKTAMDKLLNNVKSKHVCISYSTDGIISEDDLLKIIKKYAKEDSIDVMKFQYRKYKSKIHNINPVYELIYYYSPKKVRQRHSKKKTNNRTIKYNKSVSVGFIKSPLNYIGGKYKLLNQIIPLFPDKISTFVDLFSGGGNVGINVEADKVFFNDINTKINELFRYFQGKNPEILIDEVKTKISEYKLSKTNESGFKQLRDDYNSNPNPLDLYVLVSYSFNYQFRFNNDLKYNNPFGKNRSQFSSNMEKNLFRFVDHLNNIDAVFTDEYFNEFNIDILDSEAFVYADPPYLITTGSYNDGNRGFVNWTKKQEQELYDLLDTLNKRNIKFALSNVFEHKGFKNDMLISWSKKYNIHHLKYSYNNSSYNTKKLSSDEVLITNY